MTSPQAKAIATQFRLMRSISEEPFDLQQERENTRDAHELTGMPSGVTFESGEMSGVSVLRAIPEQDQGRFTVVFLHGGAFCLMSAWTHHRFAGYLARSMQGAGNSAGLQPRTGTPLPNALNECVSVIAAAIEDNQHRLTALMGDSAGGGLALSALLQMRDVGIALPFGAVLMAPWLDLTLLLGFREGRRRTRRHPD